VARAFRRANWCVSDRSNAKRIPQFVENLPDFFRAGRVNGDRPYRVRFEEFPAENSAVFILCNAAGAVLGRHHGLGYGMDQGTKHYPALPLKGLYPGYTVVVTRDRAASRTTGQFKARVLQERLTIDQSIDWANPAHAPMSAHGMENATPYLARFRR